MGTSNAARMMSEPKTDAPADPARLTRLVREHFKGVFRIALRLGVPRAVAEDAAQEVFVILSRKLSSVEVGREKSFLVGTAVRVAANIRRSQRARAVVLEPAGDAQAADPGPLPDALMEAREARALLERVLTAMPDEHRTVFVLFEFEGLSQPEIADVVEIPVGTVASRLRRAREIFDAEVRKLRIAHEGRERE